MARFFTQIESTLNKGVGGGASDAGADNFKNSQRTCLKDGIILLSFLASVEGRYETANVDDESSSMRGRVYALCQNLDWPC